MTNLYVLGEVLYDCFLGDAPSNEIRKIRDLEGLTQMFTGFEKQLGGAPFNVAAYNVLLGGKSTLLALTGDDGWGVDARAAIEESGVALATAELGFATDAALVREEGGMHEFVKFLWGSVNAFEETHVNRESVQGADIVHIGTLAYAFDGGRKATNKALFYANKAEKQVSLDVNLRNGVYNSPCDMYLSMHTLLSKADIVKMTASELMFAASLNNHIDLSDLDVSQMNYGGLIQLGKKVHEHYNPKGTLLITLGEAGAIAFSGDAHAAVSTYNYGEFAKACGAGDCFMAAALHYIGGLGLKKGTSLTEEQLGETLDFASRLAGISVTSPNTVAQKVGNHESLHGSLKYPTDALFRSAVEKQLCVEYAAFERLVMG